MPERLPLEVECREPFDQIIFRSNHIGTITLAVPSGIQEQLAAWKRNDRLIIDGEGEFIVILRVLGTLLESYLSFLYAAIYAPKMIPAFGSIANRSNLELGLKQRELLRKL